MGGEPPTLQAPASSVRPSRDGSEGGGGRPPVHGPSPSPWASLPANVLGAVGRRSPSGPSIAYYSTQGDGPTEARSLLPESHGLHGEVPCRCPEGGETQVLHWLQASPITEPA